jgi:hypothetical protein
MRCTQPRMTWRFVGTPPPRTPFPQLFHASSCELGKAPLPPIRGCEPLIQHETSVVAAMASGLTPPLWGSCLSRCPASHQDRNNCSERAGFLCFHTRTRPFRIEAIARTQWSRERGGRSLWQKRRAEQKYGKITNAGVTRYSNTIVARGVSRSWQPAAQTSAVDRLVHAAADLRR